jgi:hypothetical protein
MFLNAIITTIGAYVTCPILYSIDNKSKTGVGNW